MFVLYLLTFVQVWNFAGLVVSLIDDGQTLGVDLLLDLTIGMRSMQMRMERK